MWGVALALAGSDVRIVTSSRDWEWRTSDIRQHFPKQVMSRSAEFYIEYHMYIQTQICPAIGKLLMHANPISKFVPAHAAMTPAGPPVRFPLPTTQLQVVISKSKESTAAPAKRACCCDLRSAECREAEAEEGEGDWWGRMVAYKSPPTTNSQSRRSSIVAGGWGSTMG